MKAITLDQPWASLIVDCRKKVETRSRPWHFIGWTAIHAGKRIDEEACVRFGYNPASLPRGAVICVAYKHGCVQFPSALTPPDEYGDYTPGRFGYLLSAVNKFIKPIPTRGWQGFWNWQWDGVNPKDLWLGADHFSLQEMEKAGTLL